MTRDAYAHLQNSKYPSVRVSKKTLELVREIAKRWHVSRKEVIAQAVERLAENIDYINSL